MVLPRLFAPVLQYLRSSSAIANRSEAIGEPKSANYWLCIIQPMARLGVYSGALEDKLQLQLQRDVAGQENKAVYHNSIFAELN